MNEDLHKTGSPSIPTTTPEHPAVKFQLTADQCQKIAPVSAKAAEVFLPYIQKYAIVYGVVTPLRMAMFLAQVFHESGCLKFTREIWGPTEAQKTYERDVKSKWPGPGQSLKKGDRNYKAWMLGNVHPGDGKLFAGHGLIQVTGRANHFKCSHDLFGDDRLLKHPELLATPEYAVLSAFWFWGRNKLNELADGKDALENCTRRINGGLNGLAERKKYYENAIKVLAS